MLTPQLSLHFNPEPSTWRNLLKKAQGSLFDNSIEHWQTKTKEQLGLPTDCPMIIVGHQPTVFHAGILAKFIAGDILAKQVGGVLVHLVVDHHVGDIGTIEIPVEVEGRWQIEKSRIAPIDDSISLKDQDRITPSLHFAKIATVLQEAKGGNAAMQFGNAMDEMMKPYAQVDACIASSNLLDTDFGKAIVDHMFTTSERCNETYNNAIQNTPRCHISMLQSGELPLWTGIQNSRAVKGDSDLRPRSLLLTLLARIGLADVFIHGTGGFAYDRAMELWSSEWLGVNPCPATMVTASLYLQLRDTLGKDARRDYFEPFELESQKQQLVRAIQDASYQSEERDANYQALQSWLHEHGMRPDKKILKQQSKVNSKRDWAFPLYSQEELLHLREAIEQRCLTTDFAVAK